MKPKLIAVFLIALSISVIVSCHSSESQKVFVNDTASVLDSIQFQKLNDLYIHHEKITTNEIALLTTNSLAKVIIDSVMIPQFKKQKYYEGLWDGSVTITRFLEKPENKIK